MIKMEYNKEKIQEKYESLLSKIGLGQSAIKKTEALIGLTGIQPSKEVLKRTYIKSLERCLSECTKDELKEFADKYQILSSVSKDEIQKIYLGHLKEGTLWGIEGVAKITGIQPILEENTVQEAYLKVFQDYNGVQNVSIFKRFSKIEPKIPKEKIQEKYLELILGDDFYLEEFEILKKLTQVEPEISEEVIQNKYKTTLEEEYWTGALDLKEFLNVEFSKDIVSTLYSHWIQEGKYGSMHKLKKTTGISPNEELIQNKYLSLIDNKKDLLGAIILKREFEVVPNINNVKIQEIYSNFSGRFYLQDVEKLKGLTGISPNNANVQKGYQILIKMDNFDDINKLQQLTGIEPSKETYKLLGDCLNR